jgi:hypothetical protein
MPGGGRTGPMAQGPMTGRAAGYCAGFGVPGYVNPLPGRRLSRGWGRGFRWRHWYCPIGIPGRVRFGYAPAWAVPAMTKEQEAEPLKAQVKALQEQLDATNKRIQELGRES